MLLTPAALGQLYSTVALAFERRLRPRTALWLVLSTPGACQ